MPNTYTQLYIHIVFAVKHRSNLIQSHWKNELYKYITGIVTNKNQKTMIINGMPDHIHILVSIKPDWTISDLVRDIKSNSSKWINEKHWVNGIFEWQNGYGAFSVSSSQLMVVIKYIENQENHHKNQTFKNEYIDFLKGYQIDYNDKYLLEDFGVDDNNK